MISNKNVPNELLTIDNIFKYISPYDIYDYYIPDIKLGRIYLSPLREENNPSFGIFISKSGELCWNDYAIGGGSCFKLVMLMEKTSFYGALNFINKLFDLNLLSLKNEGNHIDVNITKKRTKRKLVKKKKPKISIKSREWLKHDIEYFYPLDHTKLKIIPIQFFWLDEQRFNTDKYAYAYRYGKHIYKIYQPELKTGAGKWWSNISVDVEWFGHNQLDYDKDLLFVCSSNKDASVLHQIGYNAIAPHTEAQMFSATQYKYYKKKFKRIIIFYDNDEKGVEYAIKFSQAYNLDYIALEEPDTKDPFEFIKKYNLEELKLWISQWI